MLKDNEPFVASVFGPPFIALFTFQLVTFPLIRIFVSDIELFIDGSTVEATGSDGVYRTFFRLSGNPEFDSLLEEYAEARNLAVYVWGSLAAYFGCGLLIVIILGTLFGR
ncbi:MAG: hypothetical protein AAF725_02100 [Acidobacteriota bacterium]